RGGLTAWWWIFVIEGLFTVLCAAFTWHMLPNTLASARFLTQEEKECAISRQAGIENGTGNGEESEKFSWGEVRRGLVYPLTWLSACAYFGLLSAIYSI